MGSPPLCCREEGEEGGEPLEAVFAAVLLHCRGVLVARREDTERVQRQKRKAEGQWLERSGRQLQGGAGQWCRRSCDVYAI